MAKSSNLPELFTEATSRVALEERKAERKLRTDILAFFDSADRESLAQENCYRGLFPAFKTYAETLLNAYAQEYFGVFTDPEDPAKYGTFLRKKLLPSLLDRISQTPFRKINWSDDSDDEGDRPHNVEEFYLDVCAKDGTPQFCVEQHLVDDHVVEEPVEKTFDALEYLRPEGIWEQLIDKCLSNASLGRKLPNGWEHRFVYVLRQHHCWSALRSDLRYRLQPAIDRLIESERSRQPAPKRKRGRPVQEASLPAKLKALRAKFNAKQNAALESILGCSKGSATTILRNFVDTQPQIVFGDAKGDQDYLTWLQDTYPTFREFRKTSHLKA